MNQRYEHFAVRFYNRIAQKEVEAWEDIASEVQPFLIFLPYETLVIYDVVTFIKEGGSYEQAGIKFGIHPERARRLAEAHGVLPRKK